MKLGDKGAEVKKLQKRLNELGWNLVVDGEFGPKTEEAVKKFQTNNKLEADGVVGKITWAKLREDDTPVVGVPPLVGPVNFDPRTSKNLGTLDPKAIPVFTKFITEAKEIAKKLGYDYIAISGNRTWAEQDALYLQGRRLPGKIVTNARGGQSNHNFKIALDFGVFKNDVYIDDKNANEADKVHKAVSTIAKKYGIDWGGDWKNTKDFPHFEISTGLSLAKKRELFLKNGSVL